MNIIKCPHCFTQNRVKSLTTRQEATCGRCGKILPGSSSSDLAAIMGKYKYWLILGAIIIGVYIAEYGKLENPYRGSPTPTYTPPSSPAYTPPAAPTFNAPIIPISQGIQGLYTPDYLVAPLSISTPHGTEKYFVKIVDATTETTVLTIFIYGGQTFELKVPLGQYKVKYATGENWYGESLLFGPSTSFNQAETTFSFSNDGYQINGYSIELIKQINGNLSTKEITKQQF